MFPPAPPVAKPRRALALVPAVLAPSAVCWAVLFLAVPPGRWEFPLCDEWAYAPAAVSFAQHGEIGYAHWAAMPLLGLWLWSAPFVRLFGGSVLVLRLSAIALAWVGTVSLFDLLRGEEVCDRAAAFAAACFSVQPWVFTLSGIYHSDVAGLSFSLLALALYRRAFRGVEQASRLRLAQDRPGASETLAPRRLALGGACAAAVFAVTTRQNAIVVPIVAAAMLWRAPTLRTRPAALLAVVVPLVAGIATYSWFGRRPDIIHLAPWMPDLGRVLLLSVPLAITLGLFGLPLYLLRPPRPSWLLMACVFVTGAGAGLCAVRFLGAEPAFPYVDNNVFATRGTIITIFGRPPQMMSLGLRALLTVLGCLGGAALLDQAIRHGRKGLRLDPLPLYAILQVPFLLVTPVLNDRYFMVLLPGVYFLAILGSRTSRLHWPAALALLTLLAAVSLARFHDWVAWNIARWDLGRRALAGGIAVTDLEGGFEWDTWHISQKEPVRPWDPLGMRKTAGGSPLRWAFTREICPQITGRYALSFSERTDCGTLDREPYHYWLLPGSHELYLIEFIPEADEFPYGAR